LIYKLKHSLPGRVRFSLPALKHSKFSPAALAERLQAESGVKAVRVNRFARSVVVEHIKRDPEAQEKIFRVVKTANPREFWRKRDKKAEQGRPGASSRRWLAMATCAVISAATGAASLVQIPLILISGTPSYRRAYRTLTREHRLNVDVLDTIVVGCSVLWGELTSGALVAFLVNLGEWIRDFTAARSRRALDSILRYQAETAWVLRDGRKLKIPADHVRTDETVIVHVGELIPVDGIVIRFHGLVDQKTITGESTPAEKGAGDEVFAGTALLNGKLHVRTKRRGADTVVAGIVKTVENAPIGDTRVQNYAEKFADRLVAPFLMLAGGFYAFTGNPQRFLSMLIVDYGTGMRVAAPTSMLSCMIGAARRGVLVKSGAYLERLADVDTIVFDKTGTLTHGSPQLLDVHSLRPKAFPPKTILGLAAAAETGYNHPVARALVSKAKEEGIHWQQHVHSKFQVGYGVEGKVNGYFVQIGSERFMGERDVRIARAENQIRKFERTGCSTLLLAVDGDLTGVLAYADQIRPEVPSLIHDLRRQHRLELMMITGDSKPIAKRVARKLQLDRYFAETLPDQKAGIIEHLQREGRTVAMVGDGINDSPALSRSDVGISMRNGSDLTRETAHIVLAEEDTRMLLTALEASQEATRLIQQNWKIIAGFNTLALLASLPAGFIAPSITAFISNGSSILAALNGLRPLL
jgi:heavy metal translocating P-type ATPase